MSIINLSVSFPLFFLFHGTDVSDSVHHCTGSIENLSFDEKSFRLELGDLTNSYSTDIIQLESYELLYV